MIWHLIGGEAISATPVVKLIASDGGRGSSQSPRLQLSQGENRAAANLRLCHKSVSEALLEILCSIKGGPTRLSVCKRTMADVIGDVGRCDIVLSAPLCTSNICVHLDGRSCFFGDLCVRGKKKDYFKSFFSLREKFWADWLKERSLDLVERPSCGGDQSLKNISL